MKARTAAIVGLALSATSCNAILGIFRGASLAVTSWGGGLAGLEVTVQSGGDTWEFTAADLSTDPFGVPESGTISVELRLRQDGAVVAEGTASWALEGDVEWTADVQRTPHPSGASVDEDFADHPNPVPCWWWWCYDAWRFDIAEDAVSEEGESLWLVVWRVHPDECQDVCW